MKKIALIISMMLAGVFAKAAQQANCTPQDRPLIIAKGENAKNIFDSISSRAGNLVVSDSNKIPTQVKILNFSSSNNTMISQGEKGLVCEHYRDNSEVKSVGADYQCGIVDLSCN